MVTVPKEHERPSEDDEAREQLGPQGVPGKPNRNKMTPDAEKQTPRSGEFDGNTA